MLPVAEISMLPVAILQVRFQPLTRPSSLGAQSSEREHLPAENPVRPQHKRFLWYKPSGEFVGCQWRITILTRGISYFSESLKP